MPIIDGEDLKACVGKKKKKAKQGIASMFLENLFGSNTKGFLYAPKTAITT